jgi:hypothetical protein
MAEKSKQQRFSVVLERTDTSGSTTFIHVPFDVRAVFGRARLPVRVTVEGYTYRSTVSVYGGKYFLPVRREVREAAKVEAGQRVQVVLEPDDAPRTVEVPADLAAALKRVKGAWENWKALSFSNQKEHAQAILGAKKAETRSRRVERAVELISSATPSVRRLKG